MAGSRTRDNQGDPPGQAVFMASAPEEPSGGSQSVRSLSEIVTDVNRSLRGWYGYFQQGERVCECGWLREATVEERVAKAARAHQSRTGSGAPALAERMVCAPWAAELESGTRVDACNRKTTKPLTGKPDLSAVPGTGRCGRPARPVWREGQGSIPCPYPYPRLFRTAQALALPHG